ncbi:endonuclease [Treponema sp. R8-4-B8]
MKKNTSKLFKTAANLFFNNSLPVRGLWVLVLFFLFIAFSFACDLEGHFEFTVSNNEGEILYCGCYDAINMGPHIIEYVLTKERAEATGVRRPSAQFTQDRDNGVLRQLLTDNGYSLPYHSDYTNSGYDRGHMAPNADFNDTRENALMTFFIANIWPQTPNLNRVEWLRTENKTRKLASEYLFVRVIIIVDEFKTEKVGNITIPSCFKRRVYDLYSGVLIYEIEAYQ